MARIDQIRFATQQTTDGRPYDVVRLWVGGIPFTADLTPQTEVVARRIADETGQHIFDARASTVGF